MPLRRLRHNELKNRHAGLYSASHRQISGQDERQRGSQHADSFRTGMLTQQVPTWALPRQWRPDFGTDMQDTRPDRAPYLPSGDF